MTSAEADKRINLSEHTLSGWMSLANDNELTGSPRRHAQMAEEEIEKLIAVATEFPGMGGRIEALIDRWMAFITQMELRLN